MNNRKKMSKFTTMIFIIGEDLVKKMVYSKYKFKINLNFSSFI
jgi:hypothetical protein